MISTDLVAEINRLARKQRSTGLTDEEKAEQHRLRQIYLKGIKAQIVDSFSGMGLKPHKGHKHSCSCKNCKH